MKISIIIPNYNGFDLVKKNLYVLLNSIGRYDYEVVIIDDFSKKEQYESLKNYIESLHKKNIFLFRNDKNLGFSETVNNGVKQASGEYLVFLNTDVAPENNFLLPSLEIMESDKSVFGVGFMDKSIEGEKTVLRGRGMASWQKGFLIHRKGEIDSDDTFWISGGSSIVRRDIFLKLGGFDKLYSPFYWEDIDLSYRAVKAGYKIKFEKKSIVVHEHSIGAIKKHYSESTIKKIAYRNQFIFVWKNINDKNLTISHLLWLPYHFVSALIRFDAAFFYGFLLALLMLPDIIVARKKQSEFYTRSDSDIILIK